MVTMIWIKIKDHTYQCDKCGTKVWVEDESLLTYVGKEIHKLQDHGISKRRYENLL